MIATFLFVNPSTARVFVDPDYAFYKCNSHKLLHSHCPFNLVYIMGTPS